MDIVQHRREAAWDFDVESGLPEGTNAEIEGEAGFVNFHNS